MRGLAAIGSYNEQVLEIYPVDDDDGVRLDGAATDACSSGKSTIIWTGSITSEEIDHAPLDECIGAKLNANRCVVNEVCHDSCGPIVLTDVAIISIGASNNLQGRFMLLDRAPTSNRSFFTTLCRA